jgi:hypothetical protein
VDWSLSLDEIESIYKRRCNIISTCHLPKSFVFEKWEDIVRDYQILHEVIKRFILPKADLFEVWGEGAEDSILDYQFLSPELLTELWPSMFIEQRMRVIQLGLLDIVPLEEMVTFLTDNNNIVRHHAKKRCELLLTNRDETRKEEK